VAILPIRATDGAKQADHAICIVDAAAELESVEYPQGRRQWTEPALNVQWNGDALLIRRAMPARVWAAWLVGLALVAAILYANGRRYHRRTRSGVSTDADSG